MAANCLFNCLSWFPSSTCPGLLVCLIVELAFFLLWVLDREEAA